MTAILFDLFLVAAGIAVLLFGGDFLVRGAAALARRLGVAPLIVGLTVVAFGTSAPEMVVSAAASLTGAPGIALGNIVGSNIANVFLVLGLPAIIAPLATAAPGVRTNAVLALGACVILVALTFDRVLSLHEGAILFALIIGYVIYLGVHASRAKDDPVVAELTDVDGMERLPSSTLAIALTTLVGIIALPLGANILVEGARDLATAAGVSEAVIGLTIIAFGTSLPELATAMVAAMRRHSDMAIGNVIGSNIFNVFAVGGISGVSAGAIGQSVAVEAGFFQLDYWVMIAASAIVLIYAMRRQAVGRLTGIVFFAGYCAYIAALALMNPPSLPSA